AEVIEKAAVRGAWQEHRQRALCQPIGLTREQDRRQVNSKLQQDQDLAWQTYRALEPWPPLPGRGGPAHLYLSPLAPACTHLMRSICFSLECSPDSAPMSPSFSQAKIGLSRISALL